MKRMACVIALASSAGLATLAPAALADPAPVLLASGLQIAVVGGGTPTADGTVNLDVSFRGGSLHSVELFIDGARVKRKSVYTRDTRGLLKFALDGELFTPGDHEILIKAFDLDGTTATATTSLHVGGETSGLAQFLFPKNRARVQGVVPIELKLDPSIRTPYVSFYIDNDFLAMTNYAPYTYNWDSARVPNGKHTIVIDVIDGETTALIKKLSMQVEVNNPGGFTNVQKAIPSLDRPRQDSVARALTTAVGEAQLAAPKNDLAVSPPKGLLDRISPSAPHANGRTAQPHFAPQTAKPASVFPLLDVLRADLQLSPIGASAPAKRSAFASPDRNLPARRTFVETGRPGLLAMLAEPQPAASLNHSGLDGLARVAMRPRRAGNIAVRPSLTLGGTALVAAAPTAFVPQPVKVAKSPVSHFVGLGAFKGRARSFQVAFDNSQIAFDVQPRVEHGLPLAPFRQIFEHTGGQVAWYGKSKTVRAVSSSHEIEFHVGSTQAKVNNRPLTMEAKPYIEKGRAIVPLSFVRDALNVTVQYDPATGHMLIESKK